jgi:hypothetical protein
VITLALFGCAATPVEVPPDTTIEAASDDLPPEQAAFLGVWRGDWGGVLPALLIVSRIDRPGIARVDYVWGRAANGMPPGSLRARATIAGDTLSFGTSAQMTFALQPDGTLAAERIEVGRIGKSGRHGYLGYDSHGTMTRVPPP